MEEALRAVLEPHRCEILRLVRGGELTAGEIAAHFTVSRPAISQHIRMLKDAGLIAERRQGTRRFYRAQPETMAALRAFFDGLLGEGTTVEPRPEAEAQAPSQRLVSPPGPSR
jgi:DNA-binding transcriptional ArsR family regulator